MSDREHVQAVHGPGCMCIHHQHERAVAAAKAQAATSEPAPKQLEVASKPRKAAASSVINPSLINPPATRKRGRPIKSNDPAHQQARERARRYRDRKAAAQARQEAR